MHFHTPFHPFQKHPEFMGAEVVNLLFILAGLMVALFLGPLHLD